MLEKLILKIIKMCKSIDIKNRSFFFFATCTIICSVIVLLAQCHVEHIAETYGKQMVDRCDSVLSKTSTVSVKPSSFEIKVNSKDLAKKELDEIKSISNQYEERLAIIEGTLTDKTQHQFSVAIQEIQTLLENNQTRIRQEYATLQVWCAIMTIVFLVFSFYSLFKADDLVKQGTQGIEEIAALKKEAKDEVKDFKQSAKEGLDTLKASTAQQATKMYEELKATKETIENDLKSLGKNIETGQFELEKYVEDRKTYFEKVNIELRSIQEKLEVMKKMTDLMEKDLASKIKPTRAKPTTKSKS